MFFFKPQHDIGSIIILPYNTKIHTVQQALKEKYYNQNRLPAGGWGKSMIIIIQEF